MKNTLKHDGTTQLLLANVDDDTNRLFINDVEIPSSSWVGNGTYTQRINGVTISITKVADTNGDIMLQKISNTTYKLVRNEIEPTFQFSHVGQIIISTTLDNLSKIQAIYGNNTTWILHSGYMLRGATSGVTANSAVKDGGQDSVTPSGTNSGGAVQSHKLTTNEMPSHTHSLTYGGSIFSSDASPADVRISLTGGGGLWNNVNWKRINSNANTGGGQGHTHGFTQPAFTGNSHTNLPQYKNVYIWERTA